jgi:drug/metabolite transporter (DMT)-like permease
LLVAKVFMESEVSFLEGSGASIAFIGALLCSKDSSEAAPVAIIDPSAGWKTTMLGNFYALVAAFLGVIYLVFAKTFRIHTNLYFFMWFIMFVGSLETLILIWMVGEPMSFSLDVNHGIFGWVNLDMDRLPLELIMVVVCNLFGAI